MSPEEQQSKDIDEYARDIGLDTRLIHAPKTEKQADELLSIQKTIQKYDAHTYSQLNEKNSQINEPYRDKSSILSKITEVENYINKYYDGVMFLKELNDLENLKQKIQKSTHIKKSDFVKLVLDNVEKELLECEFSINLITKGTSKTPSLRGTFKSLLTEPL